MHKQSIYFKQMRHVSSIIILSFILILSGCKQPAGYITNEGLVFGTSYRIIYQSEIDHQTEITAAIDQVNQSLSTYESKSVISRVNQNDSTVVLDPHFIRVFNKAVEVTQITNGAFDMTVAPLVNIWGFGFSKKDSVTPTAIDSILAFVGMDKIRLEDNKINKQDIRTMLDASAIAKGYGVDVAAECIEQLGIANYLVEIGGEIRTRGVNAKGEPWRVGIDKPVDDRNVQDRQLQAIIALNNQSLATSGNYRNFYYKDNQKFAHTINPKTGYPVQSNILSSSVIAPDCMTADAYATAFMVLGLEKSMQIVTANPSLEAFFICSDSTGNIKEVYSPGFEKFIKEIVSKE